MKIRGNLSRYSRIELRLDKRIDLVEISAPSGETDTVYPFEYQPILIEYDVQGIEHISKNGDVELLVRYTPRECGEYTAVAYFEGEAVEKDSFTVHGTEGHGYVEVSQKDSRYFAYSDGEPFFWMGINLCFPTPYEVSSGTEFGLSGNVAYIGLRQYERWMKKCSENGVNVVRIWLGHDYWSPDTENTYELDGAKLSKIDAVVDLAKKYGLKLKLTVEQFRHFIYDKKSAFNKQLYHSGNPCESSREWLSSKDYIEAWMYKIGELAKRYSGDTSVVMIELWNEMNCVGGGYPLILEWNEKILPRVKALFPHQLVTNSLGSLDSDRSAKCYKDFCWDKTDVLQIHRYLDQGAPYGICGESPIPSIKEAFDLMRTNERPMLLAETGAVNNCHSAEFKYYSADDRGIIFVDCVYTPIFVGSAGCGNIWHWDRRYVESKNLYKYFEPLAKLVKGIDFAAEGFEPLDLSTDGAQVLVLKGRKTTLGFVRNKSDSWMNTLRDMLEPREIDFDIQICGENIEVIQIWDDERADISLGNDSARVRNMRFGALFKIKK